MMLNLILLSLALLMCNAIYCGQRVIADFRHSRQAQGAWGLFALSGTLMALAGLIWVLLASLAHY
jgi:hypothetical protein